MCLNFHLCLGDDAILIWVYFSDGLKFVQPPAGSVLLRLVLVVFSYHSTVETRKMKSCCLKILFAKKTPVLDLEMRGENIQVFVLL